MLKIEKLRIAPLPPLTFDVAPGECLAIEGRSGAGKTRLLRAIADLDPADGYVRLEGVERRELPAPAWRRRVRYVATEPGWWMETAAAHVAAAVSSDKLQRLLHAVDLAPTLLARPIRELSTGERRRLALVLALADEPTVLLLDEPTASLDPGRSALVGELIRFQLLSGRIVLMTSHDPAEIARLADRQLLLTAPDGAGPDSLREARGAV